VALFHQEVQNEFQKVKASLPAENQMRTSKEVLALPSHYQRSWLIWIQTARVRSEQHKAEENE
jgi:hypothetical protein